MSKLQEIMSELEYEIFRLHRADPDLPPFSYRKIFTLEIGKERQIILEVKRYGRKVGVPQIIRNFIKKNEEYNLSTLSKEIGITRSALTNYVNGKVELSFSLAKKLSEILKISPERLLEIDVDIRYRFYKNKEIFIKTIEDMPFDNNVFPVAHLKQPPGK